MSMLCLFWEGGIMTENLLKNSGLRASLIILYCLSMGFSFFAGNVFIDSYDTFIVRFIYPDIDILLISLIALIIFLFLYTYFRDLFQTLKFGTWYKTTFLIFTWFGLIGVLTQNMLVPLNHFVSYVELALVFFLLLALLIGQVSEKYEGKLKFDYLKLFIGLIFLNVFFIFIKKIVFEKLGTAGINLVVEIDLLGGTFNITSLLIFVFVAILSLMIWSSIKNFQIIASDIKQKKQLDPSNKNFLGIIINQGAMLLVLLFFVFISFYYMKNQNALKDFLHYSFSANLNYYATMKWTYICNLSFFTPFTVIFFQLDLAQKGKLEQKDSDLIAPIYNFNMTVALKKEDLEQIVLNKIEKFQKIDR